jgi:hypothetical protein
VLLDEQADWRWMIDRSDSPWYPSMRLFRQERAGAWEPLIVRVASELTALRHTTAAATDQQFVG